MEKHVETALPKPEGLVMVLKGKRKGERGRLMERNSNTEEALIQLDDDMESVKFKYDEIAEYVAPGGGH